MLHYAYTIPLLPLAGAVLLAFFGKRLGNPLAGWFATLLVAASFVVGVFVFLDLLNRASSNRSFDQTIFTWIPAGGLQIKIMRHKKLAFGHHAQVRPGAMQENTDLRIAYNSSQR